MKSWFLKAVATSPLLAFATLASAQSFQDQGGAPTPLPEPGAIELLLLGGAVAVAVKIARRKK